jgi:ABC-type multidrug transport system ATPase subunit
MNYSFVYGRKYAILGPNGSGKSTFLKVLSSALTPSEGQLVYKTPGGDTVSIDAIYSFLAVAAPYMELVEEFTLREMVNFHFKFKSYLAGFDFQALLTLTGLERSADKEIRFFSSGMKQRLKLALACCSDCPIVLLDEPTTNLDVEGEAWYQALIEETIGPDRLLIIGSNQKREYSFCDEHIDILSYKGGLGAR